MKLIFFLVATWLLNSSKWKPIQKKLVAIFKDKQNLFHAVIVLEIKLGKRSLTCYKVDIRMDDVLRFGKKLNEEVCCGFIFADLFNSLYL